MRKSETVYPEKTYLYSIIPRTTDQQPPYELQTRHTRLVSVPDRMQEFPLGVQVPDGDRSRCRRGR
jgi:hypothetical protein